MVFYTWAEDEILKKSSQLGNWITALEISKTILPHRTFCSINQRRKQLKLEKLTLEGRTNICGWCGKEYPKKYWGHGKFCSIECYRASRKINKYRCVVCNGETTKGRKYCGSECRKKDNIQQFGKKCPICGKQFIGHGRVYCSNICREKAVITRPHRILYLPKTCPICGIKHNKNQIYCSRECSLKSTLKRNEERRRTLISTNRKHDYNNTYPNTININSWLKQNHPQIHNTYIKHLHNTGKRCTKCKQIKPANQYQKNITEYDTLQGICKQCRKTTHPKPPN